MRKININITRPTKPKKEAQPPQDNVWPTWDEDDEGEPTLVELTLYDYATYLEDGVWYGVDDWNNDDLTEIVWEETQTFNGEFNKPFHVGPRDTTYRVYGNADSKVRAATIAREFSSANEKRWERKPLGTRASNWRYDGNRWYAGGTYIWINPSTGVSEVKSDYSMFNIRVELVSSPDVESTIYIDPDSFHDGEARRLKMKYPEMVGEIEPCVYRGQIPGQRLGIKVGDQSKSFAHYIGEGLAYGYDWIDNAYFCPFDTSDDTNFKITIEPDFTSAEIPGRMIAPGKWDVGLIPRRWLYFVHYRHQINPKATYEDRYYAGISGACDSALDFNWLHVDNQLVKTDYMSGDPAHLRAYKSTSIHNVAYFWGRFPPNFTAQWYHETGLPTVEDTSPVGFWDTDHNYVGSADLIWSETYTQAQTHFVEAGGSTVEAEKIRTGGLSCNLHVCSDSSAYLIKIGASDLSGTVGYGSISQIACTSYGGPVVTRSDVGYAYQGFSPAMESEHFGIQALWNVIEGSDIWQNTLLPLRTAALAMTDTNSAASRIDMVPWGVAISPSKTGDLVGVIRTRERAYFVWRKTDEEITPKTVGSTSNPIRFESNKSTGELGDFFEGNYEFEYGSGDENLYDADYCDLFVGDSTRKLTHVGREIVSSPHEPDEDCDFLYTTYAEGGTEGVVELHAPAYVMLTKERAFDDIDWTNPDLGGWNVRLESRCARCNAFYVISANVRNSY